MTQNDGIMFGDTQNDNSNQFNMRFLNNALVIGSNDGNGNFITKHVFR